MIFNSFEFRGMVVKLEKMICRVGVTPEVPCFGKLLK